MLVKNIVWKRGLLIIMFENLDRMRLINEQNAMSKTQWAWPNKPIYDSICLRPSFHLFTFLTSNHNKCNSITLTLLFANFLFLQFSPKMPNSLLKKKCRIAFNASTHFFSSSPQRVQHAKVTAQEENRLTFVAGLSSHLFIEVFYQVWAGPTVLWCTQQKWPCVRHHFEFIISQMIFFIKK